MHRKKYRKGKEKKGRKEERKKLRKLIYEENEIKEFAER